MASFVEYDNKGAPNVPFYSLKQPVPAGTPVETDKPLPKLFTPLKIKKLLLKNRVGLSPMVQYGADSNGIAGPYYLIHYGAVALRGAGLLMTGAAGVSPEGRISPNDLGIWNDEQALALKSIVDFIHTQDQYIGIQLAHAGRKGSAVPLYVSLTKLALDENGGFVDKLVAPSALPFNDQSPTPNELSVEQIKDLVKDFGKAAKRSTEISGFDFVEIHAAHGYLIHNFLSKISNQRIDSYGGSFENRIRFLLEIIEEVKKNIDFENIPIFVRISSTDNTPHNPDGWKIEDSIKLSNYFIDAGVDLIDVSSGGNTSNQVKRGSNQGFHAPNSKAIKDSVGDKILVSCVGGIKEGAFANKILEDNVCDITFVGRAFLKNPGLVWQWGDELGVRLHHTKQLEWPFYPPHRQSLSQLI
ncbi:NADH:flavin oxidoreductase/NADH oxidase [Ascoidea rubescens DSM 1968]|uniref:FMN-linked oxidoreductase n=1 Tax=Ascoidea rubescens DSM 1968 TaxID=1344418 RepID=A0A1D2VMV7_9ASCO|nr:FMN-linked oxidoreductase [Ascoidea rubescens DSM 1968]ODV62940.1 FMN-linked oxidoreductase [Ascoidea rubescens DSM 1968]